MEWQSPGPGAGMYQMLRGLSINDEINLDTEYTYPLPLNYMLSIVLNGFTVMVWENCFDCWGDFVYGGFFETFHCIAQTSLEL